MAYSESFDDGEALFEAAARAVARGSDREAHRTSPTGKAGARATGSRSRPTTTRSSSSPATRAAADAAPATFGALVLAVNEGGELRYVGNVGTGFDDAEIRQAAAAAASPSAGTPPPFADEPKLPRVSKGAVQWVEPKLVVQVRYGEWTHDGHLRHPAYLGDPRRQGARRGRAPEPPTSRRRPPRQARASALEPRQAVLARRGDHQGRPAPLLPDDRGRCSCRTCATVPFTMRRYPDGAYGKAFFQKNAPTHMPDWIPTYRALVSTRESERAKKWVEFPLVNDELALLLDGQHGLHRPERLVLARRQARPAGLRPLRPRPDPRSPVDADRRGRADPQGAAGRARAGVVSEDERRQGLPCPRPDRTARDVRGHARVRRARRGRDRANAPEARHDRMVEGAPARRPHRREPERRGQDDRVGLLGAPAAERARARRRSPGTR